MSSDGRGRKAVGISGAIFLELFREGATFGEDRILRVTNGLPCDAEFCGLSYDGATDLWMAVFSSAEWPAVPDGFRLEVFRVEFRNEELPRRSA